MKISQALAMLAFLAASCSEQYLVNGNSSVQSLEGKTLYLKVFDNDEMRTIDSSGVVHGKFRFNGLLDSVMMGNVFFGEQSVMPIVIESGKVTLQIDETMQSATGTPLNDSLSNFIRRKTQLDDQLSELPHRQSRLIMEGYDLQEINEVLDREARDLTEKNDRLVTNFIRSNYNNVLGPGIFMIMTNRLQYPVLTPQIEEIITHASPYFLGNPYVKDYIRAAEANMEKMRSQ